MPVPVEQLSPNSSMGQIRAAISESIAQMMEEGMEQMQAVAATFEMARKITGKDLQAPKSPSA